MPITPEAQARITIDALLQAAGWHICNVGNVNIHAAAGVAIREFPLNNGFGFADYLLYVNGKACGVIEAKKEGATLRGVELQSSRYAQGLPTSLSVQYIPSRQQKNTFRSPARCNVLTISDHRSQLVARSPNPSGR